MKKRILLLLLGLPLISFTSCETYRVTPLSSTNYSATDASQVEIFITTQPTKDYVEIGTVSVRTVNGYVVIATTRSPQKANAIMREQAALIGGHAIINYREEDQQIKGTVIRYTQ